MQKGLGKARVAVARKLGIRLWIMLRDQIDYEEFCRRGQKHCGVVCAGCLKRALLRMVSDRLIRLPASLLARGVRITHHGPS